MKRKFNPEAKIYLLYCTICLVSLILSVFVLQNFLSDS